MYKTLLTITFLILTNFVLAQTYWPLYGSGLEQYVTGQIKKDSLGVTFYATIDSSIIVYKSYDNTVYKVYNRKYKILTEGSVYGPRNLHYFERYGKWLEYYDNGKAKSIGYYHRDRPIGLWQIFYPNGQLQETYTIALIETDSSENFCRVGSYQEFYDNGQLKINGFYKTVIDSVYIEGEDENGKLSVFVRRLPTSKKYSIWEYYKPNGVIEKREDNTEYWRNPNK